MESHCCGVLCSSCNLSVYNESCTLGAGGCSYHIDSEPVTFLGVIFFIVCLNLYCFLLLFYDLYFSCRTTIGIKSSGLILRRIFISKTMVGDSTIRIEKFNGKNSFGLWQIKMKALLMQLQIWCPLIPKSAMSTSDLGTDGLMNS